MPNADPRWDVRAIVEKFGGAAELLRLLNAHGYPTTETLVRNWLSRQGIPRQRLAQIVAVARAEGMAFTLDDYVVTTPCP